MRNVAITTQGFLAWGGGIDLLKNIVQGLVADQENCCVLLIPQKELPRKNILYKVLRFSIRSIPYFYVKDRGAELHFSDYKDQVKIVHYRRNSLQRILKEHKIDIVLPCAKPIPFKTKCSWIGYLPDCQHQYLGHLFTVKEINQRDKAFQKMIDTEKMVLVNSVDAKKDLVKFYGARPSQVRNLPFCPTLNLDWLENNDELLKKYSLPSDYFMMSNQFWKHKDHITAFRALARSKNQGAQIVCTGKMEDYRDANYITTLLHEVKELGLERRVHFLGFIPKKDQIEILKNSLAIIQPTLFEGGPGGGCVYDAIALGIPCIISDIDINEEVEGQNVFFFRAGCPDDLADKLDHFLSLKVQKTDYVELQKMHELNLSLRANCLKSLISEGLV